LFKKRLIPVLYLKDGWMVRSQSFEVHQYIGDPVVHVKRMVQWDVDELIVLDISSDEKTSFEHQRSDYKNKPVDNLLEFINLIAIECCIPLTFGGHIRNFEDIAIRIQNGADKISLNTAITDTPELVTEAAEYFGSQAIVASIDYRVIDDKPRVFVESGKRSVDLDFISYVKKAVKLGAGEIFLNSIDRDGNARGFDLDIIEEVSKVVSVPVIACGGAGIQNHFSKCFESTSVSAVAAGNIFHFTENAYPNAKKFLKSKFEYIR
jgi:imidazole glycerol-phosphate synthase subunit HisF